MLGNVIYNYSYKNISRAAGGIVGGFGKLICAIIVYLYINSTKLLGLDFELAHGIISSWITCMIVFMAAAMSFGIVFDVTNRVVLPERRSFANAILNFLGNGIGGTLPPYVAGKIIESKR